MHTLSKPRNVLLPQQMPTMPDSVKEILFEIVPEPDPSFPLKEMFSLSRDADMISGNLAHLG